VKTIVHIGVGIGVLLSLLLVPDASDSTNPVLLTIVQRCALERDYAPSQTLLKVSVGRHYLTRADTCKNITELPDKLTGAELFGLKRAQSLAWHSPGALLTALPARLSALGG